MNPDGQSLGGGWGLQLQKFPTSRIISRGDLEEPPEVAALLGVASAPLPPASSPAAPAASLFSAAATPAAVALLAVPLVEPSLAAARFASALAASLAAASSVRKAAMSSSCVLRADSASWNKRSVSFELESALT